MLMVLHMLMSFRGYMAPEYLFKEVNEISTRFDIYSLGLIIIEITTREENCAGIDQDSAREFINKVSGNVTRICEDFNLERFI